MSQFIKFPEKRITLEFEVVFFLMYVVSVSKITVAL